MNFSFEYHLESFKKKNKDCKVSVLSSEEAKKEFGDYKTLRNEGWHPAADSKNDVVIKLETTFDEVSKKSKELADSIKGKVVAIDRDEFEDVGVAYIRLKGVKKNG